VVYHDADGAVREQRARAVVMACNAVGTARLLLNSRSTLFPDGLANGSGLVGRGLMMHPVAMVTGVFDKEVDGHKGPLACSIFSHQFYETDPARGFVRGYGFQVVRTFGPVAAALGGVGGHERVPWGSSHRAAFSELFNHSITVAIIADDLAETTNRVELDPELMDGDGIPAPRVVYKTSDNSRKMLDHGIARATELMEAAGARRVLANPQVKAGGWHLLGTAVMGADPGASVVNAEGRSHDVRNLYVVDGSIFATGGAVNPTSTIQALALYIADAFKRGARNGK
jgi:choline dehydrogenase-like flavoprotein